MGDTHWHGSNEAYSTQDLSTVHLTRLSLEVAQLTIHTILLIRLDIVRPLWIISLGLHILGTVNLGAGTPSAIGVWQGGIQRSTGPTQPRLACHGILDLVRATLISRSANNGCLLVTILMQPLLSTHDYKPRHREGSIPVAIPYSCKVLMKIFFDFGQIEFRQPEERITHWQLIGSQASSRWYVRAQARGPPTMESCGVFEYSDSHP